jgi:hypothetical protein
MESSIPIPEGSLSVLYGVVVNIVVGIWLASWAWYRIRSHDSRLDKLETRVEDHGEKIAKLMLDVSNRLERIETKLTSMSEEIIYRRNHS